MTRLVALLVMGGALAGTLRAQTPADISALERDRDSLAGLTVEALLAAVAILEHPRDPIARLRYGILLSTVGERLDSAPILAAAADQFYEVTVRRPKWVYGWYGLGVSKAVLARFGAREIRSPHQSPGTGWAWAGSQALIAALKLDSTFTPATAALARLAPRLYFPSQLATVSRALDRGMAADSGDPALWILHARSVRAQGDHERALRDFGRAATLSGALAGEIHLEVARELFALGRHDEARQEYLAGAGETDTAGVALYRQDLGYIADSAELAAWDGLSPRVRTSWVERFWRRREEASGRPVGSRLIEHNRRWRYARAHYASLPTWARQYDFGNIYRTSAEEFDDRGAVYLRHGEPDGTASAIGGTRPPLASNESWLYYRPEGNLLFHFMAGTRSGWRLVTSLDDIGRNPDGPSADLYSSRMGLDGRYGILAMQIWQDSITRASFAKLAQLGADPTFRANSDRRPIIATRILREREQRTAEIHRGMSTDSDPLRFEREMAPVVQVFGAGGGAAGAGRLVVAISLQANDRLVQVPLPDGSAGYLIRLRVTSADDAGHTTLDVDSLVRLRTPRPLARGEHLSLVRTFDLPATGEQRVRLILTDTARAYGAVRVVDGVPLPDLGLPHPEMSDLIVGKLGSGVTWQRPEGGSVPLHPLNAWRRDDAIEIGFELAGLSTGEGYKVRIAVADLEADSTRPPKASVEFENRAAGGRELITQSLGLRGLRPGRYLLTATVTVGDRILRRDRRITVVR